MVSLNGHRVPLVAVDAMGGDNAPDELIKGAVEASRQGAKVVLVGPRELLREKLDELGRDLPIVHAPEAVSMHEPVMQAVRRKESSLQMALDLVASQEVGAAISAGNSGAIMAMARRTLGSQTGIERPAFGGTLPSQSGGVFVLDIGANSVVKPANLVQFAIMGEVYLHVTRGLDAPRVGLLSNGAEDSKGTKEVKEANELLRKLDINFVGNVEGNHIYDGDVDVIVCDGFSGNVLLKTAEGTATQIIRLLRSELSHDLISKIAAAALIPAFSRIRKHIDYEEYGGAAVLGVDGVMVNCHGRSGWKAVTNAILQAQRMASEQLVEQIGEALRQDASGIGRRKRLVRALHLRHE